MDNVLITGGTGFIGQWLCSQPHGVVVPIGRKAYEQGDGWQDSYWDYIIHLAPAPVDRVIECAKRNGSTVLLASSGGVYDRDLLDYFRMKMDDENKLLASGLDVKIAHIFTTCGAHMRWEQYAIGNFIQRAAANETLYYTEAYRSYMYGSDLAKWLWTILLEGKSGAIYEVGADVPYSMKQITFAIANHFDPRPLTKKMYPLPPEPRPYYVPDISRARDELRLEIEVPFEEAIARTVEDWRNEQR